MPGEREYLGQLGAGLQASHYLEDDDGMDVWCGKLWRRACLEPPTLAPGVQELLDSIPPDVLHCLCARHPIAQGASDDLQEVLPKLPSVCDAAAIEACARRRADGEDAKLLIIRHSKRMAVDCARIAAALPRARGVHGLAVVLDASAMPGGFEQLAASIAPLFTQAELSDGVPVAHLELRNLPQLEQRRADAQAAAQIVRGAAPKLRVFEVTMRHMMCSTTPAQSNREQGLNVMQLLSPAIASAQFLTQLTWFATDRQSTMRENENSDVFAKALQSLPSLRSFSQTGGRLEPILCALRRHAALTRLDISFMSEQAPPPPSSVGAIAALTQLREVDFCSLYAPPDVFEALSAAMSSLTAISRLSLAHASCSPCPLRALASSVSGMSGLAYVNMTGLSSCDSGMPALLCALKQSCSVSWLALDCSELRGNVSEFAIAARCIGAMTGMQHLDFQSCSFQATSPASAGAVLG